MSSRLRLIAPGLVLVALALGAPATASGGVQKRDMDCSDFSSQAAAQHYFDENGGSPSNNFDNLDGDWDGIVCESNPCPCADPGDGGSGGGGGSGGSAAKRGARIVSVTDGDTVKVRVNGREENVRLIGIDTPEVFGSAECGGAQASASMKKLLKPGDRIKLVRDRSQDDRDVYGRLFRYVEESGRDVSLKQIQRGWAQVYRLRDPVQARRQLPPAAQWRPQGQSRRLARV